MSRGRGIHGVGMQRDVGVVLEGGTPAWTQALNDAVVCLMIEKKEAVEDLPALLSVPGVDMVQCGMTDYRERTGTSGPFANTLVSGMKRGGTPDRLEPHS